MATLAEINETLTRVDDNTETTSKGINSFVNFLKDNKRKDLENAREAKNATVKMRTEATTNKGGQKEKGDSSVLDTVRNMLAGASLARLAPVLGRTLLKRVLGPAAIAMFAEDIVEMLLPDGLDNPELKKALTGGLQGAALGFAIGGPLGAAIGGGVGALMTNENFKNAVKELGTTLKEQAKVLYEKLEPTIINFKNNFIEFFDALGITKEGVTEGLAKGLKFVGDAAASGVESLTKLVKGDFEFMDIVKGITTIGAVAALLMPGKFVKFLGLLAGKKGLLGLLTKGATALGLGSLLGSSKADAPEPGGKPTPKPQPGSVVRSASGSLMLAGADGKATTVKAPAGSKVGDMPKASGITKFPKLAKALSVLRKVPLIGGIAALAQIATMNPITVNGLAKILGGVGGGAIGAALGSFGGPLGTFAGGLAGMLAGETLGLAAAQFLLGKKVDAFGFPFGFVNDLLNGKEDSAKTTQPQAKSYGMSPGAMGGPIQTLKKPTATGGSEIKSSIQTTERRPDAMGVTSSPTIVDNSNRTNINNNSSAVIGQGNIIDIQDQFLQYT